jgi:hypothetical protein
MYEMSNAYTSFKNPEGKILLERPRTCGRAVLNWIHLTQDKVQW